MRTIRYITFTLLLTCSAAFGGDAITYDGTWKAIFQTEGWSPGSKVNITGTLVIKDQGGMWEPDGRGRHGLDACISLAAPIIVQSATADTFVFKVEKAKTFRGCADALGTVRRVDENKLEGDIDKTSKLILERK